MSEWLIRLGYEGQLATWLVASFLLYTLASQLAWQSQWLFLRRASAAGASTQNRASEHDRRRDDRFGRFTERWHDHPLVPWAEELVRLIYYLGIPFMAAVNGLLGADLLGINGTDWVEGKNVQGFLWEDWARGAGLVMATVLAVVGVWFIGRRFSRRLGLTPVSSSFQSPLWQRLLHVLYDQIHWAFYRSGPILWLDDLYWGAFAGLALVLLEAALNPAHWWKLRSPETAGPPLIRLGVAWVSTLLFLGTQNLWLTTGVHLALAGALGEMVASGYSHVDGAV